MNSFQYDVNKDQERIKKQLSDNMNTKDNKDNKDDEDEQYGYSTPFNK